MMVFCLYILFYRFPEIAVGNRGLPGGPKSLIMPAGTDCASHTHTGCGTHCSSILGIDMSPRVARCNEETRSTTPPASSGPIILSLHSKDSDVDFEPMATCSGLSEIALHEYCLPSASGAGGENTAGLGEGDIHFGLLCFCD